MLLDVIPHVKPSESTIELTVKALGKICKLLWKDQAAFRRVLKQAHETDEDAVRHTYNNPVVLENSVVACVLAILRLQPPFPG